jgi:hypothetical protein
VPLNQTVDTDPRLTESGFGSILKPGEIIEETKSSDKDSVKYFDAEDATSDTP